MFLETIAMHLKPIGIVAGGIIVFYIVVRSLMAFDIAWCKYVEPKRQARQKAWIEKNIVHIGGNVYVGKDTVQGRAYLQNLEGNVDASRNEKGTDSN